MNAYFFLNSRPRRFVPYQMLTAHEHEENYLVSTLNQRLYQYAFINDTFAKAALLERYQMASEDHYAYTIREQKRISASYRKQEQLCRIQRATTEKKIEKYAEELRAQMLVAAQERAVAEAAERTSAEQAEIQRRNQAKDAFLASMGIEKKVLDELLLLLLGDGTWEQDYDYNQGICMRVPTLEYACQRYPDAAAEITYSITGK